MRYVWLFFMFAVLGWQNTDNETLGLIHKQLIKKDNIFKGRWPEFTVNGEWKFRKNVNWFSGFIAGELFIMYDLTGDRQLIRRALVHADSLIKYSTIDYTHDMGFIFLPSCVKAFRETGDIKYKQVALQAAEMLYKRFNPRGHFIRAWGKLGTEKRSGWIIIDTMMNLELLFWAAEENDIKKYKEAAVQHALTTLREMVRPDYSSFHVVEFDPLNGAVLKKRTHQGYADSSTWARGQAWAVYGFTNAYNRSGNEIFLQTAQKMANYYLKYLPDDYVPYWDLDLTGESILRDASAGAILASALYDLAALSPQDLQNTYNETANKITETLLENYLFTHSERPIEQGILLHTIYNYHKNWGVDESFPAGDYYFLEALKKYYQLNKKK